MRGRKPKPLALKVLEGYRADRTNFAEPKIPAGSTVAPEWLTGHALNHWNELAPVLSKAGMLTEADRFALRRCATTMRLSETTRGSRTRRASGTGSGQPSSA